MEKPRRTKVKDFHAITAAWSWVDKTTTNVGRYRIAVIEDVGGEKQLR